MLSAYYSSDVVIYTKNASKLAILSSTRSSADADNRLDAFSGQSR